MVTRRLLATRSGGRHNASTIVEAVRGSRCFRLLCLTIAAAVAVRSDDSGVSFVLPEKRCSK